MKREGKITCYIAMSLDGCIAREDGNVDWLPAIDDREDYGYYEFLSTIDGIVVGNSTYEQFIKGQAYPFGNRPCYVFSYEEEDRPHDHVEYIKGSIEDFAADLRGRDHGHFWLMGGATIIAGFMVADAVDDLMITVLPVILGNGIPLFIPGIPESLWKLKGTRVYPHGIVQLHYRKEI
jgi:dihydrofolate reductase